MKARTIFLSAAFAAAAVFASPSMAQGYIGGAIGQSDADVDCTGTLTCDTKDTAFKVYGGYMFVPYLGVEAAYFDLGKVQATLPGNLSGEIKSNGFALYGVAAAPIDSFVLFGKLGVASTKVKVSAALTGVGSASDSETNANVAWGIGAAYNFSRNFGMRLEWERFRAEFEDEKADVDVISLGAHFRF